MSNVRDVYEKCPNCGHYNTSEVWDSYTSSTEKEPPDISEATGILFYSTFMCVLFSPIILFVLEIFVGIFFDLFIPILWPGFIGYIQTAGLYGLVCGVIVGIIGGAHTLMCRKGKWIQYTIGKNCRDCGYCWK